MTEEDTIERDEYKDCPHDETDHGICLSCGKQTDMNAHDYVEDE